MLPLGQHLALAAPWWSWDCQAVRKALWASVLIRLRRQGNERLKANGMSGKQPSSWRDTEFLRREVKTHRRVFEGKTNLCLELLLGYAGVIGIDAVGCFPGTDVWVAEAAVYLSHYGERKVRGVEIDAATVYASHVIRHTAGGPKTSRDVERDLFLLPANAREVVLSVSDALAPVLTACDPEAKLTHGGNGQ